MSSPLLRMVLVLPQYVVKLKEGAVQGNRDDMLNGPRDPGGRLGTAPAARPSASWSPMADVTYAGSDSGNHRERRRQRVGYCEDGGQESPGYVRESCSGGLAIVRSTSKMSSTDWMTVVPGFSA